ncbi:MAG: guanidinoacetate N-methyltransferase [Verrucomicrobiales bacterium]|jgi:guanidinoacetate N-methyltransferase
MRRLKRTQDFEASITITNDAYIRPPRDAQRSWLVNRALKEFADDLGDLDAKAKEFVAGKESAGLPDRMSGILTDDEIMEDWQIPVMQAMAETVTPANGHILEIGFGRGMASEMIQQLGPEIHTIIECNDSVVQRYAQWRATHAERDIRLIHSKWQDATDQMDAYDAIFFHSYPLNNDEFLEHVAHSPTFAAHFFPTAAAHLVEGGAFTYLTNELDSFSRAHQRMLFQHFSSFSLSQVTALDVPDETGDAQWGDSMVIVKAVK